MRMIGLALLAFVMAGAAILVSQTGLSNLANPEGRASAGSEIFKFEIVSGSHPEPINSVRVARYNDQAPVILSGLPAYGTLTFLIPIDAQPVSATLDLQVSTQALEGVEAVFRVSIDGQKRGEHLLRSGANKISVQVQLSPRELVRDQLVVSMSLIGSGPHMTCGTDRGIEAVAEIETTSALIIETASEIASARDKVRVGGGIAFVAWQDENQIAMLSAAVSASSAISDLIFVPSADAAVLTADDLQALQSPTRIGASDESEGLDMAPIFLAAEGGNQGLKHFHHGLTWRSKFEIPNDGQGTYANALELDLGLGLVSSKSTWSLTVTLNGRGIHKAQLRASQDRYSTTIALPHHEQSSENRLEIRLVSSDDLEGVCNSGPELSAELLPNTRIIKSDQKFASDLAALREQLTSDGSVSVSTAGTLTTIEAQATYALLRQLFPHEVLITPSDTSQILTVPRGAQFQPSLLPPDTKLLTLDASGNVVVTSAAELHNLPDGTFYLLVSPKAPFQWMSRS